MSEASHSVDRDACLQESVDLGIVDYLEEYGGLTSAIKRFVTGGDQDLPRQIRRALRGSTPEEREEILDDVRRYIVKAQSRNGPVSTGAQLGFGTYLAYTGAGHARTSAATSGPISVLTGGLAAIGIGAGAAFLIVAAWKLVNGANGNTEQYISELKKIEQEIASYKD